MNILVNISEEDYKSIKEQVDKRDYPDMRVGRAIVDGILFGKLKKCKVCGRKPTHYDINVCYKYNATVAKLECRKCGNTAGIAVEEYITNRDAMRRVADLWNDMN